jgi:hypothetical protein
MLWYSELSHGDISPNVNSPLESKKRRRRVRHLNRVAPGGARQLLLRQHRRAFVSIVTVTSRCSAPTRSLLRRAAAAALPWRHRAPRKAAANPNLESPLESTKRRVRHLDRVAPGGARQLLLRQHRRAFVASLHISLFSTNPQPLTPCSSGCAAAAPPRTS